MEWALTGTESGRRAAVVRTGGSGRVEDAVLGREEDLRLERLWRPADQDQAFRLRHLLFAETLHWVPEHPSGREIDEYDRCTEMIGILDGQGRVLGQARMHPSSSPYMIEREFAETLGHSPIPHKGRDTAEVTRFGLDPGARGLQIRTVHGRFDLFAFLMKGLYRWCVAQGANLLYAVVDTRMFRLLHTRGFPFEALAEPKVMPDGVVAVAIRLDWNQFREENRQRRPGLLAWFDQEAAGALDFSLREVPAGPAAAPWPPPGAGSPHPASAGCSAGGN
jgi:N-acyl-L-homoserine lactone synthetase